MRKFNKKEFSIKPILKPMVILSVILTFVSFYIMREFSMLANSNIFDAKSGNLNNNVVSDREVQNVGRIFLLVFNTCVTLFMNLVGVLFVLGFVVCIYRVIGLILSLCRKLLLNVKYSIQKSLFAVRQELLLQRKNDLYLVNSTLLN